MNRSIARLAAFSVVSAGLLTSVGIARADEAGDKLKAQIAKAYKETTSYDATIQFHVQQKQGRRTMSQGMDIRVAYDREAGRLLIDRPDLTCASDGEKLRVKHEQLPGKYLEAGTPKPLTLDSLNQLVPFMASSPLPDVAALLSDDPFAAISGGAPEGAPALEFKALPVDPADKQARPGLQLSTKPGIITIRVDPKTNLISSLLVDIDVAMAGGKAGDTAQIRYDIDVKTQNKGVAKDAFAFDTTGAKSFPTVMAMISGGEDPAGGPGAPDAEPAHPLVGKPAPALELKDLDGNVVKLSEVKSDVVVLDFWATWCPPCVKGLPKVQAVADWAKENKKSVSFFTVNVREGVDKVREFLKANKLTMPALLDSDGKASEAYLAESIPQTVIIAKGQIVNVIVGLAPDEEAELKKEIDAALSGKPVSAEPAAAAAPAPATQPAK